MASIEKKIRKKLEAAAMSDAVSGTAARVISRHIEKVYERTEWEFHGREDVIDAVAGGKPIIFALWHGRLAMASRGWNPEWSPYCVITSAAIPGRIVGRIMRNFGLDTMPMKDRKNNTGASLQVARMMRAGTTIGFAIDGPDGPKRVARAMPIDWARLTGAPIWLYTNSVEKYRTINSWDNLMMPKPGGRGVMMYRKWDVEIPKKIGPETREAMRMKLQADLDALTLEADQLMGHDSLIN